MVERVAGGVGERVEQLARWRVELSRLVGAHLRQHRHQCTSTWSEPFDDRWIQRRVAEPLTHHEVQVDQLVGNAAIEVDDASADAILEAVCSR